MYISKEYQQTQGARDWKITATEYEKDSTKENYNNSVYKYLSSFKKKYENILIIKEDQITYVGFDEKEIEWINSLRIKNLSSKFQYLDYLEGTGTQYIDTLVKANGQKYTITIDFQITENIWNTWLFGDDILECGLWYGLYIGENGFSYLPHKSVLERNKAYKTKEYSANKSYWLFARNWGSSAYPAHVKIFSVEIYENDNLLREFIPCYAKTKVEDAYGRTCLSGTPGMYDTVEGKFYTNQGTGEFLKGKNIYM